MTTASGTDVVQTTWWSLMKEHVRREMWSYLALFGLLYLYLGIIICVYALKGVFTQRIIMVSSGVFLCGAGWIHLFFSYVLYRHHKRKQPFTCCGGEKDDDNEPKHKPPGERTRPRGHSLVGFLTPEFAKYAEFAARDRRYDSKKQQFFKVYDPTQISISFAHRYWREQQKPLLKSGIGNPALFPSSLPGSPSNARPGRKKFKSNDFNSKMKTRRQLST